MTGSAPVPVPITSRRHFQGIFSSTDSGVCPNSSRNFLDGFFLRLRTVPRSITTSCSWVTPSMRIEPKENFSKRIFGPPAITVAEPVAERKWHSEDALDADFGGVAQVFGGEFLMGSFLMR